ncbi:MAG: Asp-tRNA(Asn)/Glu-tRNA(Gln) amidotransferase subunit GatC [Alphaproteobacteria bacterium]|nr:Asp-tRNA(Asn)/Glu-tRNA(Gln) amidotransferase subunit GatC [Alphaproteobacteria bacterium]
MSIDDKTVRRVARLARLHLEPGEIPALARELSGILDWVEQLKDVNTDAVAPLASPHRMTLRMREDVVTDGDKQGDILANAPQAVEGFFAVPKVVE